MRYFQLLLIWLLRLGSLSFLAACGNDPTAGTTTVSGQVVEAQSRKPVGNGTVQFYEAGKTALMQVGNCYACGTSNSLSPG